MSVLRLMMKIMSSKSFIKREILDFANETVLLGEMEFSPEVIRVYSLTFSYFPITIQ